MTRICKRDPKRMTQLGWGWVNRWAAQGKKIKGHRQDSEKPENTKSSREQRRRIWHKGQDELARTQGRHRHRRHRLETNETQVWHTRESCPSMPIPIQAYTGHLTRNFTKLLLSAFPDAFFVHTFVAKIRCYYFKVNSKLSQSKKNKNHSRSPWIHVDLLIYLITHFTQDMRSAF